MKTVFFDGYCNLCNGFVNFLMQRDRHNRLQFASLQGVAAKAKLPPAIIANVSSVALQDGENIYTESAAAIRTLVTLGGIYSLLSVFLLVPRPLRDTVYRFIARNRYKWFGKSETCRMPTPEEKEKLLP